jgi:hypothetical protein
LRRPQEPRSWWHRPSPWFYRGMWALVAVALAAVGVGLRAADARVTSLLGPDIAWRPTRLALLRAGPEKEEAGQSQLSGGLGTPDAAHEASGAGGTVLKLEIGDTSIELRVSTGRRRGQR